MWKDAGEGENHNSWLPLHEVELLLNEKVPIILRDFRPFLKSQRDDLVHGILKMKTTNSEWFRDAYLCTDLAFLP